MTDVLKQANHPNLVQSMQEVVINRRIKAEQRSNNTMAKLEYFIGEAAMAKCKEDHDADYIKEDGQLTVRMSGLYTEGEIQMRLAQLREANQLYKKHLEWVNSD